MVAVLIASSIATTLVAGYVLAVSIEAGRRHKYPLGSFGDLKEDERQLLSAEKQALVHEYLRQQQRTFALAWVTVLAGAILSVIILVKVLTLPTFDLAMLSSVVGLASDLAICKASFRLYRDASHRLEHALGIKR
ncbi:MAG TPA: hypothetical protein VH394_13730 [Thermoanaerobaculia bacterium]|nr:hypothetical protein [Thermoanaerobaculia bacterium]